MVLAGLPHPARPAQRQQPHVPHRSQRTCSRQAHDLERIPHAQHHLRSEIGAVLRGGSAGDPIRQHRNGPSRRCHLFLELHLDIPRSGGRCHQEIAWQEARKHDGHHAVPSGVLRSNPVPFQVLLRLCSVHGNLGVFVRLQPSVALGCPIPHPNSQPPHDVGAQVIDQHACLPLRIHRVLGGPMVGRNSPHEDSVLAGFRRHGYAGIRHVQATMQGCEKVRAVDSCRRPAHCDW
mmetsp:Transcript_17413/g.48251  ORF Transcript_17413/g.48251 Transcript_17413/m.48251 type:complete len:234 (-) Transcript_17413:215-916(-)